MANIFLSYAREDLKRARLLAERLESQGWSVWWDRDIPYGQDFGTYIQRQLDEASCILVLWSKASVESEFVKDEANEGRNGRLVPLLLDRVRQPLGFRQRHTADLSDWTGDASDDQFVRLLKSIGAIVAPQTKAPASDRLSSERVLKSNGAIVAPQAKPPASDRLSSERDATEQFDLDAYISYAPLDDASLVDEKKGWVSTFAQSLEWRLGQLLGRPPRIRFDSQPPGNDILRRAAVIVTIVSPRYVHSERTTRELQEFCKAAVEQGGVEIHDKSRVFKVLKTPVPLDQQPPPLPSLLGYEFFKIDPESGRFREFDEAFGPEARQAFLMKLDDLAHDIAAALEWLDGATT